MLTLKILLPLQVILPMFFAVTLLFFKSSRVSNILSMLFLTITLLVSLTLLIGLNFSHFSSLYYLFGNFSATIGIEYKTTKLSAIISLIVSFLALTSFIWGIKLTKKELGNNQVYIFNTLYLVFCTGLLGIIATNDLFNIFIFLEISAISSYSLIGMNSSQKSAPISAFNYLILGSIAASLYILGIGIIYMLTGNLNMDIVANILKDTSFSLPLGLALLLMLIFLLIKGGIFPFSFWIPEVYNSAPFSFSAFLSGTSSKIMLFSFFKIIIIVLATNNFPNFSLFSNILTILSLLTIMFGSILAILQDELKKILGWSSVAYLGYILLAMSIFNKQGVIAVMLLIIAHALTKSGLFMVAGNIKYIIRTTTIKNFSGFMHKSIFNFLAFIILTLSLIGFPLTIGFSAKWYLLVTLFNNNFIFSGIVVLVSSALSIIYVWRVIEAMQFTNNPQEEAHPAVYPLPYMNIIIILLLLINIGLGLCSGILINYLSTIISIKGFS